MTRVASLLLLGLCLAAAGCGDDAPAEEPPPPGGSPLWGRRFGKTTGPDAVGLAVDGAGNVVVGGRFFATADFGGGAVTSPSNNWQAFVAKYDGAGALLWMRSLGDIYEEEVTHVAVDGAGNVVVAGRFRGTLDLGGGQLQSEGVGPDLFLARLSPEGDHLWSKRVGVSGYEYFQGMSVEPGGAIALLGSAPDGTDLGTGPIAFAGNAFLAKIRPDGEAAFVQPFDLGEGVYINPTALAHGGDGTIVVGSQSYTDVGEARMVLTEVRPDGARGWERDIASADGTSVTRLAIGADGGIFLTGPLGDHLDLGNGVAAADLDYGGASFVAALASDGTARWIQRLSPEPGPMDEYGYQVSGLVSAASLAPAEGGAVLTGSFYGIVDFGGGPRQSARWNQPQQPGAYSLLDDVFALRLDAEGARVWDVAFGNSGEQGGTAAGVDPSGDVFVAGIANGPLPFAASELDGTPYYGGFVLKLAR